MDGVDIVVGGKRAAIDAPCLGLYQDALAVGTHDVAIDVAELVALDGSHVKQRGNFLARLKRILHNAAAVAAQLGIALAIGQGLHVTHRLTTEQAAGNLFQIQFLSVYGHHNQQCQRHE